MDSESDAEYDHGGDQFLQEAKHHAGQTNPKTSSICPEEDQAAKGSSRQNQEKKKKKKLWKKMFSPWWKSDKKIMISNTGMELPAVNSQAKRVCVSGPVSSSGVKASDGGHRRPTSGPLITGLLNPTRKADNEIPYVCLNQLASPRGAQSSYGPVYMVT